MLILGWGGGLFLAANIHQGAVVGEGLLRGQLYFSGPMHLFTTLTVSGLFLATLPWLNRRLLTQRFFPDHFSANQKASWTHEAWFHLLLVATVVPGTLAMGALPVFALFFVPAWVAFPLARGWKQGLFFCVGIGVLAYLSAFSLAIVIDQPFGPTLTPDLGAHCSVAIAAPDHLPMQKELKISPRRSSAVIAPVISPRASWAWRRSSASSSPAP